ncbi:hypothetical protein KFL_000690110 [Klebsormidium nitens]|uniref:Uncharacterized protein n=1 Tax=Klebsormidium nitens TaxID=105231 RepID=A0A1Y1HV16_KLENI|nr:hypothetical protein KFL_000690110 [Klebsormidium nitens]|eukprot:GAQ81029.1 hypothetical protein KFL_000690110 [Klebsormidium nitens]
MGRAPSNSLSRSSSGEVASPVSKYAVQRSQGSLDQAAMVALSSAALGNLTVRTSAKERPGEKPGRGRAASADVQPGSPWPIAASAQRAPSSKPPLPTPPTRASSVSAAIPFPSSPPSASAVNSRLSASGPLPTSATASAPVSNGQSPTSPIARRSNSLPSAGQPPPNLGGSSSFHQSNGPSIAAGRLATGQSPGQTNSGGKASVSAGVSLSSPVAKTASTGSSKAGLAATASTSGGVAAGSPKAAKPAQPRFGFGSSSVKVTTTPISSSAAGAGGTAADASAKAGDGSSKIGSVAGLVKSGSIGADKVGVQGVKKPNPGIAPRTSVPASGRKPF